MIGATKTGKEGWRERRMSHQISVCSVIQSCLTLCDPIDRSPPGLSMGFPRQEYTSSSKGSPCPRYWTCISCTAGRFFTHWAIREAQEGWALWLIRECPRGLNESRPALQLQPAACFLWEIKAMQCKLAISRKARNSVSYFFFFNEKSPELHILATYSRHSWLWSSSSYFWVEELIFSLMIASSNCQRENCSQNYAKSWISWEGSRKFRIRTNTDRL